LNFQPVSFAANPSLYAEVNTTCRITCLVVWSKKEEQHEADEVEEDEAVSEEVEKTEEKDKDSDEDEDEPPQKKKKQQKNKKDVNPNVIQRSNVKRSKPGLLK
jgi:hypothetical protein